jgi:ferrous-iron efflux pump FieF
MALMVRRPRTTAPARERPALVATAVSVVLAVAKILGHLATGSSALLAAGVDSATDAVVSAINAWTVRFAGTPPDAGHPFGHGKVEHLSAFLQSILLFGAAVFVLVTAFRGERLAHHLSHAGLGIVIAIVSILVPIFLARFLKSAGEHAHSPALEADAAHYASDYLTNLGVVAAFVCDKLFDWPLADPIIAIVIAAAILRLAWQVGLGGISGLMDAGLAQDEVGRIRDVLEKARPEVRGYHNLMTRRSGPHRFVQVHVELDASRSFREAHRIVEDVRRDLERVIPNVVVTIHADPWPELPEDREQKPDPAALSTHP